MEQTQTQPCEARPQGGLGIFPVCLVLFLAVSLAYLNSLSTPFVYDDQLHVLENPSIQSLQPPWGPFFIPHEANIASRPLPNWTFAINWALGRDSAWGYHLFNLLVHLVSTLVLFGLVRRIFLLDKMRSRCGADSTEIAMWTTLLWAVHPLHTDAVTYISQRAASMMGLFFFAVFYLAVRGWTSEKRSYWHGAAVAAFLLGAACKETMAMALPLVFFFDAVFIRDNWRGVWKSSPLLYWGLLLGVALMGLHLIVGPSLFFLLAPTEAGWGPVEYILTQPEAIFHYLSLAIWPFGRFYAPLCPPAWNPVDGFGPVVSAWNLGFGLLLLLLVVFTAHLLYQRRPAGFALAWFFLTLAPTSTVVVLQCTTVERRMYLALAGLIALLVAGGFYLGPRLIKKAVPGSGTWPGRILFLLAAVFLMIGTVSRNQDYQSENIFWRQALEHEPQNFWVHANYGAYLFTNQQHDRAMEHYEKALELYPENFQVNRSFGVALLMTGQSKKALELLERAVQLSPKDFQIVYLLGVARLREGMAGPAADLLLQTVDRSPRFLEARLLAAEALKQAGRPGEAARQYARVLELDPKNPQALAGIKALEYAKP